MAAKTSTKGEQTRERLLQAAQDAVLRKGFAATSIEELIAAAGITKSGFLYHFRDKHELAKALLQRYFETDDAIFDELFAKADDLVDDPLHAFLAFLKLFAGVMADLPERHPGCMVASYCYQDQLHSREIRAMSTAGMMAWRTRFRERIARIAERYPPRLAVDLDALADMTITLVEGGIILDKGRREQGNLARQILMLRDFVRLVFEP